jgi:hypothetical protein
LVRKQADIQVKWFPAGIIFNDIKKFHLTIFNIVWGINKRFNQEGIKLTIIDQYRRRSLENGDR